MRVFDFLNLSKPVENFWTTTPYSLLPDNSLVLQNFTKHAGTDSNTALLSQGLKQLPVNVDHEIGRAHV